tara:strand:+ start:726 stop:1346 length:621 start_codon:yes stop_codon:yes gene_type:complete
MKRVSEQSKAKLLVIACGALAHEIVWLQRLNNWNQIELQCLDAELHNRPKLIPQKLRDKIKENLGQYQSIFVAYADCGTGGEIDRVLEEENIERLPGAHCYSFYATEERFAELAEQELGTFYLTDFLVEHFDRIMVKGLKLDRHPELRDQYFAHYTRVIYLSQRQDTELEAKAKVAAEFLGLEFRHLHTGYGDLDRSLQQQILKFS